MESGWRKYSKLLTLAGLAMMAIAAGCDTTTVVVTQPGYPGDGGSGGNPYYQAWYDVYGNECGTGMPQPGCDYYWDGSKIQDYEDPYYGSGNQLYYGSWDYVDDYGYDESYYGWAWLSGDGILYTDQGIALNEDGDQDSRDLITDEASKEKAVVTAAGKEFAQRYALAEDTGIKIASTLNDWATLSKKQKRARTAADVADFSKRLFGVSLDKAVTAIDAAQKGDQSGLVSINTDVASYWGTGPETSKAILKTWFRAQLADAGVK